MAISDYGPTFYTVDSEASVGETSCEFNCQNLPCNMYTVSGLSYPFPKFWARFIVATDTAFTSPLYSAWKGFNNYGDVYQWPLGPYNISIFGLAPSTTYYYKLQWCDDDGADNPTGGPWTGTGDPGDFVTAGSSSPPVADFIIGTTSGYAPLSVHFTESVTGGAPSEVLWDFGDSVTEHWDTYLYGWHTRGHVYSVAGTYSPALTATNVDGTDTATKTDSITLAAASVTASWTYAPEAQHGRLIVVSLSDTSTGNNLTADPISSRLWVVTKPDATTNTYTAPFVEHAYGTNTTESGRYGVALTVTSLMGVTGSASQTDAFYVPFITPSADFDGSPVVGPLDLAVTFRNLSLGDGLTAAWNFGDTATSSTTAATVAHTYTTAGTYTVTLTVTGSDTATTTASSTLSRTGYVMAMSNTYQNYIGGILQEVQWHLLGSPEETPCEAFDEFGGADNLLSIYYRRLRSFLKETELTRTEATLAADTSGVYPLPSDLISLLRVEVDGQSSQPMDERMADAIDQAWATVTDTGENMGYIIEPEDSLTLRLVPMVTGRTIKVLYVQAPDTPSVPADCLTWGVLPLPYAFSWAIKWGVVADLLLQEGEMNDPGRAAFAEELYQLGVTLAKKLFKPEFKPETL